MMRASASALTAFVSLMVGIAAGQSSSSSAAHPFVKTSATQASNVAERLTNSERDRIQWEAQQTWLMRDVLPCPDNTAHRAIHIDESNQPALTLPKLRREWLQASSEAVAAASIQRPDTGDRPSDSLLKPRNNVSPPQ